MICGDATPQPDVLIAADGSAVAVRGDDGRLAMVTPAATRLRRANGSRPTPMRARRTTRRSARGSDATSRAVSARLRDGRVRRASRRRSRPSRRIAAAPLVVVSAREAPRGCAALVIDRKRLASTGRDGAAARGDGFAIDARPAAGL